jgi:FtsP/CotA-like multicopper oxidase with cupredoxin domain
MYLIGTDGGLLDKPYPVSDLLLSPGERADVLIKGSQSTGNYRFRSLDYFRGGMSPSQTITLVTATYNGSLSPAQTVPTTINPNAGRIDPSSLPNGAKSLPKGL